MAKPVIVNPQSVLGCLQWEEFEYQPFALNDPTEWTCSPLPSGLSFDTATGRVSGAPTVGGVTDFGIIAINEDGVSDVAIFTMGVKPTTVRPPSTLLDAQWDITTGAVAFPGLANGVLSKKSGDDFTILLAITKGGVVADLTLTALKCNVKYEEDEPAVVASDGFRKEGTGAATVYLLHLRLTGPAHRHLSQLLVPDPLRHSFSHRRPDQSGLDRVDPNTEVGEFLGGGLRQADDARLGR